MTELWLPFGLDTNQQWKDAAVLLPYYKEDEREFLIFTERSEDVTHHKGQISFPGGSIEDGDGSLWITAVRETHEEIGLAPDQITQLKTLSQQFTPTGFRITPYVGEIIVPDKWQLNPNEIAHIFSVPVDHLRDPAHYEFLKKEMGGVKYIDPHFYFEDHEIWGVTGRIVCEFLEIKPK